jgi:hypothetical protein
MDKNRLIKLLNLTFSENDYEALAAIKAANKLLKEEKILWGDVVHNTTSTTYHNNDYFYSYNQPRWEDVPRYQNIVKVLDMARTDYSLTKWELEFYVKVRDMITLRSDLSYKQDECLMKMYHKYRKLYRPHP